MRIQRPEEPAKLALAAVPEHTRGEPIDLWSGGQDTPGRPARLLEPHSARKAVVRAHLATSAPGWPICRTGLSRPLVGAALVLSSVNVEPINPSPRRDQHLGGTGQCVERLYDAKPPWQGRDGDLMKPSRKAAETSKRKSGAEAPLST